MIVYFAAKDQAPDAIYAAREDIAKVQGRTVYATANPQGDPAEKFKSLSKTLGYKDDSTILHLYRPMTRELMTPLHEIDSFCLGGGDSRVILKRMREFENGYGKTLAARLKDLWGQSFGVCVALSGSAMALSYSVDAFDFREYLRGKISWKADRQTQRGNRLTMRVWAW